MSYDDEERRREYNREQDRREEDRQRQRRQEDEENRRRESKQRDQDREEGMAAFREGNLGQGFLKFGLTDAAIDYYESRSLREAGVAGDYLQSPSFSDAGEPRTDTEAKALDQLAAFGASQDPMVLSILRDPSLTSHDQVFLALLTVASLLNQEIRRETQNLAELDLRILGSTEEMVRMNYLNTEKVLLEATLGGLGAQKTTLQTTLQQLTAEENERVRKVLGSR